MAKGASGVFDAIAQHLSLLGLGSVAGGVLSFAAVEAADAIDGLPPATGSIGVVSALLFLIAYLWRVIKRQDKRIAFLEDELDERRRQERRVIHPSSGSD
jgi:hypothetical protein